MVNRERLQKILRLIEAERSVRVTDLSTQLHVSEATIRRDLDTLYEMGRIQRVHGGAILTENEVFEPPVLKRMHLNAREKQIIGEAAAALIAEGETVFIGAGTTALEVARNLLGRSNLTVITNALTVANLIATSEGISLIGIGGLLRSSELSFTGHIAELALQEVRVDKVVIGIPAIDLQAGLTNDYLPEVMTDRAIINMGGEFIVVADHTKFGKTASAYLAPIHRMSILVTDSQTDTVTLDSIRAWGVHVIVAE